MEAKHPKIYADDIWADRLNYSAFIDGYLGSSEAGEAWWRIEDAALRGNVANADGYADVDVRRKSDGEIFSVFARPRS